MQETYTVKAGDTLYGISNQFGVSVTELAELNNIKGSNLPIGKVLNIPSNTGTNPNNMFMYTVKAGDTIYSIANKYNTTPQKIIDLNYLKTTNLSIGQVIRIPEMFTPESEMVLPNYTNYTVKRGDTLYSIARDYNVPVDTIIKDNVLTGSNITIGQTLKIRTPSTGSPTEVIEECIGPDYTPPISTTPTITYTVKSGDNLYNIAARYNTSVDAIKRLNNLTTNNLQIGEQLKIPTATNTPSNPSTPQPSSTYTVKSGDNLYAIAARYNTSVDAIKRLNNLSSNNLQVGQVLRIPSSASNTPATGTTYTVKSGDNLYAIAARFNTTVDTIKRKNNLTSNNLSIGQKLII